jgi:hypothetical protein
MEDKQVRQIVAAILAGHNDPGLAVGRYRDVLQALMVNVVIVKAGTEEQEAAQLKSAGEPITVVIREFDD